MRAPISKDILFNLAEDLSGYTNLEFDVKNGNRSERLTHVSNLISSIVESESSIVVNNNAKFASYVGNKYIRFS